MGVAVLPDRWLIHGSGTSETRQTLQCLFQHPDDDNDDDNDDGRLYAGKPNGTIRDRTQSSIRLAQGPPSPFQTLTAGWANDDDGDDFHDNGGDESLMMATMMTTWTLLIPPQGHLQMREKQILLTTSDKCGKLCAVRNANATSTGEQIQIG